MDTILTDEWINGHKHRRIECVLVSWRQVECDDLLALVLSRLIETVWSLEPIASKQDVEVKRILTARYIVKPVEHIATVSDCMNRIGLGSVEKAAGPQTIRGHEPACLRSSNTKTCFYGGSTERAILRQYLAFGLHEPKSGSGGGVDDQARFIAKFGVRGTGNDFHVLNRINGNLR